MASIFILMVFSVRSVFGAEATGLDMVNKFNVSDKDVVDGDILVNTANGLVRAIIPNDNAIFGVYTEKPLVVFETGTDKPVVRSGVTMVNVTDSEGAINVADYITSSKDPGKGARATRSGYVLGVAMDKLSGHTGKIRVAIKIEYAEITTARSANRLFEYLGAAFFTNVKDPEKFGVIIRFVLAGLVLLISIIFAFVTFSKSIPKGIEAIGRNPLAKNTIYMSMLLNVFLIVLSVALGIVGAVLIIRL